MRLLIDGPNISLRSGFAFKTTTTAGFPTSVICGLLQSLRKIVDSVQPDETLIFWDGGRNEFRLKIFPEYKGKERDDDFWGDYKDQADALIKEFLPYLPVFNCRMRGQEADDLLAKLAYKECVVFSDDKDFYQLVSSKVSVHSPRGFRVGLDNFEEVTGYPTPEAFLNARFLIGDSSDKISGIKGIGEKTAKNLILKYGNATKVFVALDANPDEFHTRARNALLPEEAIYIVARNRRLMTLGDKSLKIPEPLLTPGSWDEEKFRGACDKYELKSISDNLAAWSAVFVGGGLQLEFPAG